MPPKKKAAPAKAPTATPKPLPPPPVPAPLDTVAAADPGAPGPVQFIGPDDLKLILDESDKNREGREKAEAQVEDLTAQVEALGNKLRAQKPVRFDDQKVAAAADAAFAAALMDIRGALLPLSLQSTEAARVLLRVQKLETSLGTTVTAATVVLQRAKVLAERRRQGLELTTEEVDDLLTHAQSLL